MPGTTPRSLISRPFDPVLFFLLLLTHGLPVWLALITLLGPSGHVVGLVAPALLTFLLRNRAPFLRVPRRVATAYGAIVTLAWLRVAYVYALPFSPPLFLGIVAWSVLLPALLLARASQPPMRALSVFFWTWCALLTAAAGQPVFYAVFIACSALLWFRRSRFLASLRLVSWPALTPLALSLSVGFFVVILRYSAPTGKTNLFTSQPGVSLVVQMDQDHWPWRVKPQVRFAAETCDGRAILLGLTGEWTGVPSLLRIDRESGTVQSSDIVNRASNMTVLDCSRNLFYIGSESTGEVLAFSQDDVSQPVWRTTTPDYPARVLMLSGNGAILSTLDDTSFRIKLLDADRGDILLEPPSRSAHCMFRIGLDQVWLAPSYNPDGELWLEGFSTAPPVPRRLTRAEASSMMGADVRIFESDFQGRWDETLTNSPFCAYDSVRGTLWFTELSAGVVHVMDLGTGQLRRKLRLERGVRFISIDEEARVAAVANYLTGTVTLFDLDTFSVRAAVRIGYRARWLTFTSDHERLLVPSSEGVFEIHIRRASPHPGPPE